MARRGILEVLLVDACRIRDTDCLGKMDPYVLIHYGKQERKSMVARGKGSHPEWNQKFTFQAEYPEGNKLNHEYKLTFTIMDKDTFSKDDFVGESTIYVKDLLSLGVDNGSAELDCTKYRVVLKDKRYYGEIQVALKFTVEDKRDEDLGGWKESVISEPPRAMGGSIRKSRAQKCSWYRVRICLVALPFKKRKESVMSE